MKRIAVAFVALSTILAACEPNGKYEEQRIVPLPICDWPMPVGLRLHIEEFTGHSYFWLKDGKFGQRVTFQPLPKEWPSGEFQRSDADELRLIEEVGAAKVFSLRLVLQSENGPELIDADVDAYTVLLGNVMITIAGFPLPEVRAMIQHCNDSRRR